jgi:hypothetical protein
MADETQALRNINWREVFPFTNIFRTFRVAIHPSKLLLALALLLLLYAGGRLLDAVWPAKYSVGPNDPMGRLVAAGPSRTGIDEFGAGRNGTMPFEDPERWAAGFRAALQQSAIDPDGGPSNPLATTPQTGGVVGDYLPVFKTFFNYETAQINAAAGAVINGNWLGMGEPSVAQALTNFVFNGPKWFFSSHPLFATLFAIWFLILLSVFGGAIARIAALHIARDEKISIRQALRFSTGKVLSFAFAPVIPLLILLALAVLTALAGAALLYIPAAGPIVLGAGFFLVLLAAFVMTLVLFGTVGGFNLMYPTVAVEGSDSFDAISRSFSYVFARPWRTIFYTAVALAYGALTYLFVRLFLVVMLMLAHGSVGWFLGKTHQPHAFWEGQTVTRKISDTETRTYNHLGISLWPASNSIALIGPGTGSLTYDVPYKRLKWSEHIGATLIWFWVHLAIAMLGAYVISFYFSANSMIYFLLRREVDATDLDDVYVEQADEDFSEPATEAVTPPATTETPAVDAAVPPASASMPTASPPPTAPSATETPQDTPVTKLPSTETPPPT